jgi:hypothetical protein
MRECDEAIENLRLRERLQAVAGKTVPAAMKYASALLLVASEGNAVAVASSLEKANRDVDLRRFVHWLPFILDNLWHPFPREDGLIPIALSPDGTGLEEKELAEQAFGWRPLIGGDTPVAVSRRVRDNLHLFPERAAQPTTVREVATRLKDDGTFPISPAQDEAEAVLRLRTYCFAEFGCLDLTVFNRLRGRLARERGVEVDELDPMPVVDFVAAILPPHDYPPPDASMQPGGAAPQTAPPVPPMKEVKADDQGQAQLRRRLKEPSKDAFTAYRVWLVTGEKQEELAQRLMEPLKRKVGQGTISRWLKQVKEWIEAGNVLPDLSEPLDSKPTPMDPERIELGERQDGRARHQRGRRNSDRHD